MQKLVMRFAKTANAVFGLAISHRKPLYYIYVVGVAQLEERELPKLGPTGSNAVARYIHSTAFSG